MQVRHRRRRTRAIGLTIHLEEVRAVDDRLAGVELHSGNAGLLAGIQECDAARVDRWNVHQMHRAVLAVQLALQLVRLEFLVQREGAGGLPAGGAVHRGPVVEVFARRPEGDAGVV